VLDNICYARLTVPSWRPINSLTGDHFVGKLSAMGQSTNSAFHPSRIVIYVFMWIAEVERFNNDQTVWL